MSVVTPSQSNSGDTIEASDINNPVNQLAAVINGNIDATNIADNAITAAKVAANLPTTKLQNPYKFSVYRNATLSAAATSFTKITFNAKDYDTGSNFDIVTNNRFTAPAAGFYHFDTTVTATIASGDQYYVTFYKNGTEIKRGNTMIPGGTSELTFTASCDLQLALNDYIEVFYRNGSAGGKTVSAGSSVTSFNGHLISIT